MTRIASIAGLLCAVLLFLPGPGARAAQPANRIEAVLHGAEQGDPAMQYRLAMWKFWALPHMRDVPGAVELFCLSARQGFAPAQHHLGLMYWTGNGVARDPLQAYLWFHLAAGAGGEAAADYRDRIGRDYLDEPRMRLARVLAERWHASPACPVHLS